MFNNMKLIELEPLDTVFFGDPRGMELNLGGKSLRLPLPWSISGALLYFYILNGGSLNDVRIGCEDDAEECISEEKGESTVFAFYGPFLSYGGRYWFNAPADLILKDGKVTLLKPYDGKGGYRDFLPRIYLPEGSEPLIDEFVDHEFLESYAEGRIIELKGKVTFDFEERRIGIHIDDSKRTVKAGYTFSCVHRRPKFGLKYSMLVAEKSRRDFKFSGIVRLGGEGRAAKITERNWKPNWLERSLLKGGTTVKVVLVSPAIYRRNGKDTRIPDISNLPGKPKLCTLDIPKGNKKNGNGGNELVIGRGPIFISGWDLPRNRARRMYAAVPPGTVYYLKLEDDVDRAELTLSFWKLSLFWERGFGSPLVAVGDVP